MTRTWPTGGPSGCSGVVDMAAEATDRQARRPPPSFFGARATASVGRPPKDERDLVVLHRAAAEGRRGGALVPVAEVDDLHGVTRLLVGHRGPHVGGAGDLLAVDLDDQIARPEPGGLGAAALLHLGDEGAVAVDTEVLAHLRVEAVEVDGGDAEVGHGT